MVEIGTPVTVAGITIIPAVKVTLNHWHGKRGVSFFGTKQPVGVVVISPSLRKAFRITGEEVSLDELTTQPKRPLK